MTTAKPFRVPSTPPKFSLQDIKRAIPAHCFVRSTFKSFLYLAMDICFMLALYYFSTLIPIFPVQMQYPLWIVYWISQGAVMTGIWVVAHECGHRAFSDSKLVCDVVGFFLHSFLLVPYHSWRISHGKHHKATGHAEHDEVFLPAKSTVYYKNMKERLNYEPPTALFMIIETFLFFSIGWWVYLLTHASGRDYGRYTNHFSPYSPIFLPKDFWSIILSDVGIVGMISLLTYVSYTISLSWMIHVYFVPYLIVNFWLLLYTFLHHTDISLPHYKGEQWNWLMGALATVDRDYGIFNFFHHDIGNTHVLHHICSYIPHYHAKEATKAIIPVLGAYYYSSSEPILSALINTTKNCRFVDDTDGPVLWFKDYPVPPKN